MPRKKGQRKAEFGLLPNGFQQENKYKGCWNEWYGNDNPLTLELGCGKGEMVLGLGALYPDRNFMGIDVKSDRLYVGATEATEKGLTNVAFHRLDVLLIEDYLGPGEVSEFWITFPDPFPKEKRERRRLSHIRYLEVLSNIAKPDAVVHFKTDNVNLFEWTVEHYAENGIVIDAITRDLHHSEFLNEETGIITTYENRFMKMGMTINYMRFRLDGVKK